MGAPSDDGASARAAGAHRAGVCDGQANGDIARGGAGDPADGRAVAPSVSREALVACWMSPGPARRARSPMRTWSAVVRLTLESDAARRDALEHARHGAGRCGLSQTAVSRIWRAFALQPHRDETFKLSKDPLFIEKVRDIVGLYLDPPDKALVLCVDEKTQIQALDRTQPVLPLRPGQAERRTHDYTRHGTTTLFAALNAKSGKVIGEFHPRQRAREFRKFLDTIETPCPPGSTSTDSRQLQHPQDAAHPPLAGAASALSSPLHADRRLVDQPGRAWFAALTEKQLRRGVHRSTRELETAIRRYIDLTNDRPPSPSSGPRRPTKSSRASLAFVIESLTQDTSLSLKGSVVVSSLASQYT